MSTIEQLLGESFLANVEALVHEHHALYPRLPPKGRLVKALVERAFRMSGQTVKEVKAATPKAPRQDLLVGGIRISVRGETGKATRRAKIGNRMVRPAHAGAPTAKALLKDTRAHDDRQTRTLMLRAIWCPDGFDYQLLEIPLDVLRKMRRVKVADAGHRARRRAAAGHVRGGHKTVFRVPFDAADGRCHVHGPPIEHCRVLREWSQLVPPQGAPPQIPFPAGTVPQ